jgi:hypothetical protein
MHYFSHLFWNRTLHVSDSFTVHHQESSAVYTAIRFIMQVMLTARVIRVEYVEFYSKIGTFHPFIGHEGP